MRIILYCFSVFVFFSCHSIPSDVQHALEKAGVNRDELEKVIEHYKNSGDKLKLDAAYFLIGNMPGKYSTYYSYNDQAYEMFYSGKATKDNRIAFEDYLSKQIGMLKDLAGHAPLVVQDIEVLTAEYLIENIDLAFQVWKEPWSKHFNFNEFCEYILPYRVRDEPISNWRKQLYEKYYGIKDSIQNLSDPEELALYINDLIAEDYWTLDELDMPYVSVPLLERTKAGGCDQRYVLMISLLRALGVPAMMDYAPQHNSTFKDHAWIVYLDSLHRYRPCDGGRDRGKIRTGKNRKSGFPINTVIPLADGFGSNVYRYTYAINKNSISEQISDKRKIPPFFRAPCIKNVSDQYEFDMHSICYDTTPEIDIKKGIAYLAVFGYGDNLREAAYTQITDNKMKFDHIGSGIVYLICTYKTGKLVPFSHPVLLRDSTGTVDILKPDTLRKQKLILTRKCNVSLQMLTFAEAMKRGRFEGSSNPEFENPHILYEIKEAPFFLEEKDIAIKNRYRYVRYISPHNGIHVAEIQFWGKDKDNQDTWLTGTPMVQLGSDSLVDTKPEYAFDNNIRTNFNAPSGSWIGLDLKTPQFITQIKYLPRNNFNVIEIGNEYELMYYNQGWKSLGIQKATNQFLEYNNVPTNALFLLRNRTQGKEERIFTYENGKQVWW